MFPDVAEQEINIENPGTADLGTSFLFDFAAGDFVVKDGRLVKVAGVEALKIWIEKIIRTEKQHFKVYERGDGQDEYGVTIEDLLVGHDYPPAFIEAELQREISDALTKHPLVQSISDFSVIKDNPQVTIAFTVNLTDGNTFSQEVNF